MKIKLPKNEVFAAEQALTYLRQVKVNKKLAYIIAKNTRLLGYIAKDLREVIKFPEEGAFPEFEVEQTKLARQHQNDPIGFEQAITPVYDRYPDVITARDKHQKEIDKLLLDVEEIELHAIPFELLPAEIMPDALGPLVDLLTGVDIEDVDTEDLVKKTDTKVEDKKDQ